VTCGLRDYGLEPQIWDSEPPGLCEGGRDHEWGEWQEKHNTREDTITGKSRTTDRFYCDESRRFDGNHQKHTAGSFCLRCNAWRGSLGGEPTPELFIKHIVDIFRAVWRVLRKDGSVWLNLGDSYAGNATGNQGNGMSTLEGGKTTQIEAGKRPDKSGPGLKPKDLIGIPWRVSEALMRDGWYRRSALPWVKRSAMPESTTDRPASALEYVFLLSKSQKYFFDMEAIRKNFNTDHSVKGRGIKGNPNRNDGGQECGYGQGAGRNFRNTDLFFESISPPHGAIFAGDELVGLDINPQAYKEAHFATFPRRIPEVAILAGTSEKGCCPECGSPWERITRITEEYKNITARGNKPDTAKLGLFLKKSRESLGLAQNEISKYFPSKSGGLTGCVSNWESGNNVPTIEQWGKLKEVLNLNDDFDKDVEDWWHLDGSSAWADGYNLDEKLVKRQGTAHPSQVPQKSKTIGWRPTCSCYDMVKLGDVLPVGPVPKDPIPCTVLDIFGGAMTTALVAEKHNRKWIMVELSPEYAEMGKKRITTELSQKKLPGF